MTKEEINKTLGGCTGMSLNRMWEDSAEETVVVAGLVEIVKALTEEIRDLRREMSKLAKGDA